MQTATMKRYQVRNLDCAACAAKLENSLKKMEGVDDAVVDFAGLTLHIQARNTCPNPEMVRRFEPEVELIPITERAAPAPQATDRYRFKQEMVVLGVSLTPFPDSPACRRAPARGGLDRLGVPPGVGGLSAGRLECVGRGLSHRSARRFFRRKCFNGHCHGRRPGHSCPFRSGGRHALLQSGRIAPGAGRGALAPFGGHVAERPSPAGHTANPGRLAGGASRAGGRGADHRGQAGR